MDIVRLGLLETYPETTTTQEEVRTEWRGAAAGSRHHRRCALEPQSKCFDTISSIGDKSAEF